MRRVSREGHVAVNYMIQSAEAVRAMDRISERLLAEGWTHSQDMWSPPPGSREEAIRGYRRALLDNLSDRHTAHPPPTTPPPGQEALPGTPGRATFTRRPAPAPEEESEMPRQVEDGTSDGVLAGVAHVILEHPGTYNIPLMLEDTVTGLGIIQANLQAALDRYPERRLVPRLGPPSEADIHAARTLLGLIRELRVVSW